MSDTLKQAAQALRESAKWILAYTTGGAPDLIYHTASCRNLASALEAMAEQKPIYQIARANGPTATAWIDVDEAAFNSAALCPDDFRTRALYAAPIATPEHDAKVRDAALEEAARVCAARVKNTNMNSVVRAMDMECSACAYEIRALKSTGGAA